MTSSVCLFFFFFFSATKASHPGGDNNHKETPEGAGGPMPEGPVREAGASFTEHVIERITNSFLSYLLSPLISVTVYDVLFFVFF